MNERTVEFRESGGVSRYKRIKVARDLARQRVQELEDEKARLALRVAELEAKVKDQ